MQLEHIDSPRVAVTQDSSAEKMKHEQLKPLQATAWLKILISYLLIGWCTQLPGGLFRRYPRLRIIRYNYELHGTRALLDIPFVWIPFTILFWPVAFIRGGMNLVALALVVVGILSSIAIINYVTTILGAVLVVIFTGLVSIYLARPRRLVRY